MLDSLREKLLKNRIPQMTRVTRVTGVTGATDYMAQKVTPAVTPCGYTYKSLKLHGLHQLHLKKHQRGNSVLEGKNETKIQEVQGVTQNTKDVTECPWWLDQTAIEVRFDEIAAHLEYGEGLKRYEVETRVREVLAIEIEALKLLEA